MSCGVLERDFAIAPFHYIESERLIRTTFPLSGGGRVQLKGFIDRVDDVKGSLRIVDYKSGTGKADFASLDALFDRIKQSIIERLARSRGEGDGLYQRHHRTLRGAQ